MKTVIMLVPMLLVCLFVSGWVMNVVKVCQCDFEAPFKAETIRGVGVFIPPVGAVAGGCTI